MKLKDVVNVTRGMIHLNLNDSPQNTLILAGVPRGGTTWLAEIVNNRNHYRYMFEPFYNENVRLFESSTRTNI